MMDERECSNSVRFLTLLIPKFLNAICVKGREDTDRQSGFDGTRGIICRFTIHHSLIFDKKENETKESVFFHFLSGKKENETKESVFFHFLSGIFSFHFLSGKKENETKESASLRLFCEMRDFAGLGSQVHWTCSQDEMAINAICVKGRGDSPSSQENGELRILNFEF